ncbi:20126_t:CDS:2 [Dentiscutata erythropus]|uniref:20126_t:CDS:1 n=1 Tax=Dentiscutata erythropus TaxID=1348616 RepID=A0A9N8VGP9_9GLOM|nr:20126_t:CDS:2 [Dentiscutata erythropus]
MSNPNHWILDVQIRIKIIEPLDIGHPKSKNHPIFNYNDSTGDSKATNPMGDTKG